MRNGSIIGAVALAGTLLPSLAAAADLPLPFWKHLSSDADDLPKPNCGKEQTACLVLDIDRDGRNDIVIAERSRAPSLLWLRQSGEGWTEFVVESDKTPIAAGGASCDVDGDVDHIHTFKVVDMNRDGELDVVTAEMEPSPRERVGVYWNLGKSLTWRLQVAGTDGSHNIRVADFNGDGYPDLAGANHGNHGVPTPVEILLSQPK